MLPAFLGAALLQAEAGIAVLAVFRPHVDPYYTSYYITGARSCWLPRGEAALAAADLHIATIAVAKLPRPAACYLLAEGWSDVERWGVWSDQSKTALDLPVVAGKDRLTFTVTGFARHDNQLVKIWVDGAPMGSYYVPNGAASRFTIAAPAGFAELRITFWIKHPTAPATGDRRLLGLGLIGIHWS